MKRRRGPPARIIRLDGGARFLAQYRIVRTNSPYCWSAPRAHHSRGAHYHGIRYDPDHPYPGSKARGLPCATVIQQDVEAGPHSVITFCKACVDDYNAQTRAASLGTPESKEWYDLWNLSCKSERQEPDARGRPPLCVFPVEIALKIHTYLTRERRPRMVVTRECPRDLL